MTVEAGELQITGRSQSAKAKKGRILRNEPNLRET